MSGQIDYGAIGERERDTEREGGGREGEGGGERERERGGEGRQRGGRERSTHKYSKVLISLIYPGLEVNFWS